MRIEGCGGCFEDRVYDLDTATAWRIVLVSLNDMDVVVDDVDQTINIVKFHNKDKIMQVAVKAIDEDTVHVIMDGLATKTVNDDVEVQLTHTADDSLT